MADIFNVDQYKSEIDGLKLSPEQKGVITAEMHQAYKVMAKKEAKHRNHYVIKAVAAVLVIALTVGIGLAGIRSNNHIDNWFMLSVNAVSTSDEYGVNATGDEVKITGITDEKLMGYTQSVMSGFFMEGEDGLFTKDGYKDYFACYHMENLILTGENIKSVRFESKNKGIYFVLNGNDVDYLSDTESIDSALSEFKDKAEFNNSQYSFIELRNKAPYLLWPCDGFTYENGTISTGKEENILPINKIDIILESDHSDPEISKWLEEMSKIDNRNHYGSEKYSELEDKIQKKMLEDAEINITITFKDGKTESKMVSLDYRGYRCLGLEV